MIEQHKAPDFHQRPWRVLPLSYIAGRPYKEKPRVDPPKVTAIEGLMHGLPPSVSDQGLRL